MSRAKQVVSVLASVMLWSVLGSQGLQAAASSGSTWPTPVPGYISVKPGEHPRLLFRKSDLPAIRQRAETPEGRKIVERLRATLGGGETMPTVYNRAKRAYDPDSPAPEGTFTISHMAGFGMLYQLTGDRKYAELGRQCFLKGKAGIRDRDNRYAQEGCDGELRLGPSLAMIALGYDLCYDGWDEAFRQEVALYLQDYKSLVRTKKEETNPSLAKRELTLKQMVTKPAHGPSSNHHGAIIAGAGMTVLAILGDPGTDNARLKEWDALCQAQLREKVPLGFGPYGFYAEGQGASQVAANAALVPYLQALRVVAGKDYTVGNASGASMARWLTLRWVMELLADGEGRAWYPVRHELMSTGYGREELLAFNGGMTHGGWFSQGFGAVPEAYRPALLWTYNTFVAADDGHEFDTRNYPHRAVMALVNWPIGVEAENPGKVMPHVIFDSLHGYYTIRNRWQDRDDVVITLFTKLGSYRQRNAWTDRPIKVFGVGQKVQLGMVGGQHDFMESEPDGSTSINWPASGKGKARQFAVDFSRRAGVEAVIMTTQGVKEDANSLRTLARNVGLEGKRKSHVCLTLSLDNRHPTIAQGSVDGSPALLVGGLAVLLEDGRITFKDAPGVAPGLGPNPVAAETLKTLFVPPVAAEKDIALPEDPTFSLSFENTLEEDGVTYTENSAGSRFPVMIRDVATVPGVIGNGVSFGEKGFGLIPAGKPEATPAGRAGFSLSYWVYLEEPTTGNSMILDWFWRANAGVQGQGMSFKSFAGTLDVDLTIEPGSWHHVAWVLDPKVKGKELSMWYDGAYMGDGKSGAIAEFHMHAGLGASVSDEDYPTVQAQWPGYLDEVRLFKRPLSAGEIVGLYREGVAAVEERKKAGNLTPVAIVESDKIRGPAPLTVAFDASRSQDMDGDEISVNWNFGDGTKGQGLKTSHTYAKRGLYKAELVVTDTRGGVSKTSKGIRVENRAPIVSARVGWNHLWRDRKTPLPEEAILLDASDTIDLEGEPMTFTWSVAGQTLKGASVPLILNAPGVHPLTLVVADAAGQKTTWRSAVTIPDAAGVLPAENPKGPSTAGLHYRYWHAGPRLPHSGSLNKLLPAPYEQLALKSTGTADVPQPWTVQQRGGRFWVDWCGYIDVPADGEYTFHYDIRGAMFVWVGSQMIGGWYQPGENREKDFAENRVKLAKGVHRFKVLFGGPEYGWWGGSLEWSGPGIDEAAHPDDSAFSKPDPGRTALDRRDESAVGQRRAGLVLAGRGTAAHRRPSAAHGRGRS